MLKQTVSFKFQLICAERQDRNLRGKNETELIDEIHNGIKSVNPNKRDEMNKRRSNNVSIFFGSTLLKDICKISIIL